LAQSFLLIKVTMTTAWLWIRTYNSY